MYYKVQTNKYTSGIKYNSVIERLKGLFVFIALGSLLLIPTSDFAFAQVSDFYWSDNAGGSGEIFTAAAGAQSGTQLTFGGFGQIRDVELDQNANTLWWNNWTPPTGIPGEGIYNSNLGAFAPVQVTGGAESNTFTGFASGHHKMVLDTANGKVFFTRGVSYANPIFGSSGEVSVVDMTGLNYMQLNTNADNWFPSGIERSGSTLYFGDPGVFVNALGGAVNSMDTNGANPVGFLVPHTEGHGRSHALDSAKGLLFYSAFDSGSQGNFGGAIFVYDVVNGGAPLQILSDPTTGIPDIELDSANMIIYWTDFMRGEIRSASYAGGGNLTPSTEISGLGNPFGLALAFSDEGDEPDPCDVPEPPPECIVGGEFLPIDSTSLLLAGIQSSVIWMIPILVGTAGITVFYIKTRMNKE